MSAQDIQEKTVFRREINGRFGLDAEDRKINPVSEGIEFSRRGYHPQGNSRFNFQTEAQTVNALENAERRARVDFGFYVYETFAEFESRRHNDSGFERVVFVQNIESNF